MYWIRFYCEYGPEDNSNKVIKEMETLFAHAMKNPQATRQAAKAKRRIPKQRKDDDAQNIEDARNTEVENGATSGPSNTDGDKDNHTAHPA
jgi:hypothetical protein